MSKIPRFSAGSKIPRASTNALKPINGNARPSLSKQSRASIRPENAFKVTLTTSRLKSRELPEDYRKRPVRLDTKNLEEIYNYVFKIAGTLFTPTYSQMFFPTGLSTDKTRAAGKESGKSTMKISEYSKEVLNALEFLNQLLISKKDTLFLITDFVYLYTAIVIRVSSVEDCVTKALFFVRKFLDFDTPQRVSEVNVLFSALAMPTVRTAPVKGLIQQVLASIPNKAPKLLKKIEKGVNENDSFTAEVCAGALKMIQQKNGMPQTFTPAGYVELTEVTDAKTAVSVLDMLKESGELQDPSKFARDILVTMQNFHTSYAVINAASQCLLTHIESCCPIEPPICGELLAALFSTISFSEGSGDSLDAKSSAQALIDAIFEREEAENLIEAAKTAVNFMSDSTINLFREKFGGGNAELDAIIIEHKRGKLEKSIKKLTDPQSIFDEMERVINEDDDINAYPSYLRGFLQRSYYLYKKVAPPGMPSEQIAKAKEMEKEYEEIKETDQIPDDYSPDVLRVQLELIKENIHFY